MSALDQTPVETRGGLRERFYVAIALWATRRANCVAPLFHGSRPYWFAVPDRRPEPPETEINDGFGI